MDWLPFATAEGLAVSNNSSDSQHDIDISVGEIMDSSDTYLIRLEEARIKQIDVAYAVSTDSTATGGFSDQDTLSIDTWYGVFALSKTTDTTDSDIIISATQANALADTAAAAEGFDIARLVGYVLTDGSSNIIAFVDGGDRWNVWDEPSNITVSASTGGIAVTADVPPFQNGEFNYIVIATGSTATTATCMGLLTQTTQTNSTPSTSKLDVDALITATGLGNFTVLNGSNSVIKR